ncbi:class I SAM-dependent methyltransferase [Psychrobacillus soli]|uniref:Class I SAM-dependent methyltransferase n=1 Tax=Psychrobacillus soli TaxID=1543965 RepID=A0A544TBB1_9BACI|nr:class I SAM-dependent methyltransferase [Psychrobacillus soli]TQR14731.1 class I SAM-dependent methyltransferase [Psychrobacillus soli]
MNFDPFYDELEDSLIKEFPILLTCGEAIDIGCGRGWLTRLLNNNFNLRVLGIDKSREHIEFCKANANSIDLKYEEKDIDELSFIYF